MIRPPQATPLPPRPTFVFQGADATGPAAVYDSVTAVTTFPRELGDRLSRMEQALEATSLEVERIGEGQRFLTRLFTERESVRAIAPRAVAGTHLLERKQGTPERLP